MSGISAETLAADGEAVNLLRQLTFERNGVAPATGERGNDALFVLWMSFIQAQVSLAPWQPEAFTSQALADARLLLQSLAKELPSLLHDPRSEASSTS
jgi:hypothetical protein